MSCLMITVTCIFVDSIGYPVVTLGYGIKTAAYYKRTKFLKIQAFKDGSGKAYLTEEQVEVMDALHEYINEHGKMEGFSFDTEGLDLVAEATEDVDENTGKMTVASKSELSQSKPDSVIQQSIPETQPDFTQGMETLIRQAAEIKAQGMAMPDLVTLQLAQQMTFDDLPSDLQDKVTAVRAAATPKMEPANIASQLLAQHRASK